MGVENAVSHCRKGSGTSNQGFGPTTLASCFVCAVAVREHLNWLGFCFGFVFPEALGKTTLCGQSDAIYLEHLFDVFLKGLFHPKLQKYIAVFHIFVVCSNVDSFNFMCRGLQIYTFEI